MMIWTTRFTRKKAVVSVLLLGLVMALAVFLAADRDKPLPEPPLLDSNQSRVEYLRNLGWEVAQEPLETLQFLLPPRLEEPYLSYNSLQKEQGFDLSASCGKQVSRFTYAVTNYPGRPDSVQLNLFICEGRPVAGDVFCSGTDGFQKTLVYPQE